MTWKGDGLSRPSGWLAVNSEQESDSREIVTERAAVIGMRAERAKENIDIKSQLRGQ